MVCCSVIGIKLLRQLSHVYGAEVDCVPILLMIPPAILIPNDASCHQYFSDNISTFCKHLKQLEQL